MSLRGTITMTINDDASIVSARASIDGTTLQITVDMANPDAVDDMGKTLRDFARRMRKARKVKR